jgi:hypothetical protein
MCYTKQVSRDSFIINVITSFFLYQYNNTKTQNKNNIHKILALFFGFVGLMQLFDWIFWSNQDISNDNEACINKITTKVAMFFNHLQPLILAGLIYFYQGSLKKFSKLILLVYSISMSIYTINVYPQLDYTLAKTINIYDMTKKETLAWEWNTKMYSEVVYSIYLVCLSTLSLENFTFPINIVFAFINIITFGVTGFYFKGHSIGRFWCVLSSYLPLLILIFKKILNI